MEPKHPNIVVIMADQLRRDALGCYGDPNVSTPHIDTLARGGVRFANACSTYPICVPARFTFMTGQAAHTRMIPGIGWRMSPAEVTLADEFNAAGYETIYVGKWHLYGECYTYAPNGAVDWQTSSQRSYRTPIRFMSSRRWRRNGPPARSRQTLATKLIVPRGSSERTRTRVFSGSALKSFSSNWSFSPRASSQPQPPESGLLTSLRTRIGWLAL